MLASFPPILLSNPPILLSRGKVHPPPTPSLAARLGSLLAGRNGSERRRQSQNASKTLLRRLQDVPRRSKTAHDGAKTPQGASKTAQDGSKRLQDGSRALSAFLVKDAPKVKGQKPEARTQALDHRTLEREGTT